MIKSVEIENYKNFKHLKMENFKLINFFTGQNDTGKTNLLEALYTNTGLCDPAIQVSLPLNMPCLLVNSGKLNSMPTI